MAWNQKLVGGGEGTAIYLLDADDAIVQSDGTTPATGPTHALFQFGAELVQTTVNFDGCTINTICRASEALTSLELVCPKKAPANADGNTVNGEAGTEHNTRAADNSLKKVLVVHAGATSAGDKRYCVVFKGTVNPESWNYDAVNDTFVNLNLALSPVDAIDAIAVGSAFFMAERVAASQTITLAEGDPFKHGYLDKYTS